MQLSLAKHNRVRSKPQCKQKHRHINAALVLQSETGIAHAGRAISLERKVPEARRVLLGHAVLRLRMADRCACPQLSIKRHSRQDDDESGNSYRQFAYKICKLCSCCIFRQKRCFFSLSAENCVLAICIFTASEQRDRSRFRSEEHTSEL